MRHLWLDSSNGCGRNFLRLGLQGLPRVFHLHVSKNSWKCNVGWIAINFEAADDVLHLIQLVLHVPQLAVDALMAARGVQLLEISGDDEQKQHK